MRLKLLLVFCIYVTCSLLFEGKKNYAGDGYTSNLQELWERWHHAAIREHKFEALDEYFTNLHDYYGFNGSVLIAEDNRIIYEGALGYSHFPSRYTKKDSLHINSAFQLASVSKIFTATAVLMLQDSGLIDINNPIQTYLPEFPYDDITIFNLLSHRSGLTRYMAIAAKHYKDIYDPLTNKEIYDIYARHKPITFFEPNTGFNYCNSNYIFLAELVTRVTDMPFEDYLQQYMFDPLDMKSAFIFRKGIDTVRSHMVAGYKGWRNRRWIAATDYIDGVIGDKGMYASVRDLYQFDCALNNHQILKASTVATAFTPASPRRIHNYGLGWRIKRMADRNITYHFGWWRGFHTCYLKDPLYNRTYIILTNQDIPGRNPSFWNVYHQVNKLLAPFDKQVAALRVDLPETTEESDTSEE